MLRSIGKIFPLGTRAVKQATRDSLRTAVLPITYTKASIGSFAKSIRRLATTTIENEDKPINKNLTVETIDSSDKRIAELTSLHALYRSSIMLFGTLYGDGNTNKYTHGYNDLLKKELGECLSLKNEIKKLHNETFNRKPR